MTRDEIDKLIVSATKEVARYERSIFRAGLLAAASIAQENDDTGTGMGDAIAKAIRAAAG